MTVRADICPVNRTLNYRGLPTRRCPDCGATDEDGPMWHVEGVPHSEAFTYWDDYPYARP